MISPAKVLPMKEAWWKRSGSPHNLQSVVHEKRTGCGREVRLAGSTKVVPAHAKIARPALPDRSEHRPQDRSPCGTPAGRDGRGDRPGPRDSDGSAARSFGVGRRY